MSEKNGGDQVVSEPRLRRMTLRDQFAAIAMAEYRRSDRSWDNSSPENVARWAYADADAMLAERGRAK